MSEQQGHVRRAIGWLIEGDWYGPAALAGLFAVAMGLLLVTLSAREHDERRRQLSSDARTALRSIELRLDANEHFLRSLTREASPDPAAALAKSYMADHPELVAVRDVDASGETLWAVPERSAEGVTGGAVTEPRDAQATYSEVIALAGGQPGFEVVVPVVGPEGYAGARIGVYSMDRLLRHALDREMIVRQHVSFVNAEHAVLHSLPVTAEVDSALVERVALDDLGGAIRLQLRPYGRVFWQSGIAALVLLCCALVVGMAFGMVMLNRQIRHRRALESDLREAQGRLEDRVRERTHELEVANRRLHEEMAERQSIERRLRAQHEQLAHVARLSTMGEMAAGLAHELNQPLGAIASYTQSAARLLKQQPVDRAMLREAIDRATAQARRAGRIIHRLREFVADRAAEPVFTDLNALITEVVELLSADLSGAEVRLCCTLAEPLPTVIVDRVQIQQVLVNLIRNATEAMSVREGERRLTIRTAPTGDGMVEVAVGDSGPGCDDETLARLFNPFFTTKSAGMGLGLSISQTIVEAHGGRMWAERGETEGMIFRLLVPIAKEEPPHEITDHEPDAAANEIR